MTLLSFAAGAGYLGQPPSWFKAHLFGLSFLVTGYLYVTVQIVLLFYTYHLFKLASSADEKSERFHQEASMPMVIAEISAREATLGVPNAGGGARSGVNDATITDVITSYLASISDVLLGARRAAVGEVHPGSESSSNESEPSATEAFPSPGALRSLSNAIKIDVVNVGNAPALALSVTVTGGFRETQAIIDEDGDFRGVSSGTEASTYSMTQNEQIVALGKDQRKTIDLSVLAIAAPEESVNILQIKIEYYSLHNVRGTTKLEWQLHRESCYDESGNTIGLSDSDFEISTPDILTLELPLKREGLLPYFSVDTPEGFYAAHHRQGLNDLGE